MTALTWLNFVAVAQVSIIARPVVVPIEAISWRVLTRGPDPDLKLQAAPTGDGDARKGTRDVYFNDAFRETPIYDRYQMGPGTQIDGPAIVEERESTTVVGPDATARVADDGSLILEAA